MDSDDWLQLLRLSVYLLIALVWLAIWRRRKAAARRQPPLAGIAFPTPPPVIPRGDRASATSSSSTSAPKYRAARLELDVTQFAPLSDAQARQATGGLGSVWTSPGFGRRDLIPPADDPRTNLIDRAMVNHGLITPEELIEIHEVGKRMDQVRPDLTQAAHVANRAVEQDREERRRLKEEKKRATEERKRQHAEAVARRRKTDIIFLGRGVSKGLADRTSDVAKLEAAGLPVLSTPADIAAALDLPVPRLRWLAYHTDASPVTHYVRFTVPKRRGGVRHLSAPHKSLAAAQEWVLANILSKVAPNEPAHGFVPGRGTVTNAAPHVGRAVVVNTDLCDFFPTVTFPRVMGIFRQLGYSPAVATVLGLLCTDCPRRKVLYAGKPFHVATGPRALPQGACTSPALSNLAARRLDSRLRGIAEKLGWRYTRYADDLTFSCDSERRDDRTGYLLARVRHIVQDEGFRVNEAKTRVLRPGNQQSVTGIVVNDRAGVRRRIVRRLRAILHRARFEGLAAQNRHHHPHFDAWVRGMIEYVHMVNPRQAEPLRDALARVKAS
ncbi:MAG: reverse transcriptase family protein [Tepidisphaeraceae bacterium]